MRKVLLSTSYFGSITWWAALVQFQEVSLEAHENFVKQSYRNRCYIDGPNGALMLNIPLQHKTTKSITEIEISYRENWSAKHWQALQTTYRNSPFFDTIGPAIQEVYQQKMTSLWEFNQVFRLQIQNWLQIEKPVNLSSQWESNPQNLVDWRKAIHPKSTERLCHHYPAYPQVFDQKFGFRKNLCILDLLFNEGPAAYDYLAQLEFVFSSPS